MTTTVQQQQKAKLNVSRVENLLRMPFFKSASVAKFISPSFDRTASQEHDRRVGRAVLIRHSEQREASAAQVNNRVAQERHVCRESDQGPKRAPRAAQAKQFAGARPILAVEKHTAKPLERKSRLRVRWLNAHTASEKTHHRCGAFESSRCGILG